MIHCISSVNVPWTLPSHRLIITIKELPSDTRFPTISSHTRPSQLLATVALPLPHFPLATPRRTSGQTTCELHSSFIQRHPVRPVLPPIRR